LDTTTVTFLVGLIFSAAVLYSSVGHAGASGYLAAMALVGVAPAVMKPTALTLNILVATIATVKFYRAGCFSWEILWPFALASVPFAFVGGAISLPSAYYKPLLGVILLYAAARLLFVTQLLSAARPIPLWAAIISGMGIGLLSGLTGVGGGIFLSPLLLFMGWAETRQTSGVSATFILLNSVAGLLGHISSVAALPQAIPVLATAALFGGLFGADYGSRRLGNMTIRRLLAVVLVVAGVKMIAV
jgi:hypothetical protein